jgi:molybdate transport system ATP-binding protein
MSLIIKDLRMQLGQIHLHIDLELSGRITGIFGPSGSGKTSLLEIVAGLKRPSSAFIRIGDQIVTDTSKNFVVPTESRSIGYVPQDLGLFPHMSVRQNVLYGFKEAESNRQTMSLEHISSVLGIAGLFDRNIGSLSGGEKQRVAYARALLASPKLLLMDEPLVSLDLALKERTIEHLKKLRDEFEIPILYVSHDADEIAALSDEVVVLRDGQAISHGTPQDIFQVQNKPHFFLKTSSTA